MNKLIHLLFFILASIFSLPVHALRVNERCIPSKTAIHDKFPPEGATTKHHPIVVSPESQDALISLPQNHHRKLQQTLRSLTIVSAINVLINLFRPDPAVPIPARLPRVCWEFCIGFIGTCAQFGEGSILLLFLALMLFPTAFMDVFVWGPLFGVFTDFETCTGGGWFSNKPQICVTDYSKGLGRLVAMLQSVFGGLFYLLAATICWSEYWKVQGDKQALRSARFIN